MVGARGLFGDLVDFFLNFSSLHVCNAGVYRSFGWSFRR
jgi:hypothetical protein